MYGSIVRRKKYIGFIAGPAKLTIFANEGIAGFKLIRLSLLLFIRLKNVKDEILLHK